MNAAGGPSHGRAPAVVIVHPDAAAVAAATAARLLVRLVDLQSVRPVSHIALTGGTVGTRTLAEIARSPVRDAVDWTGVHLWWGDERFLPAGDPDRKAIALSGDDMAANDAVADLIDSLGFDPVDLGPLAEGAVLQPGRELFGANLGAAEISDVVEQAAA